MDKLKLHTPDLTATNIEKLAALFPGCVTEARDEKGVLKRLIDFDQLRQELSDHIVEGPRERYHLDWPGKREALLAANAPIAKTLRPCREESVDFDTTKNLFIEGDNLDALKLLQETYLGKVKMIYIDPPYNTGNDFIYDDDFCENSEAFLRRSLQKDEVGNRMVANPEGNGRFHSDWVSMIFPRLKLARNLLRDDGIFFVSIDDREQASLKLACDQVFGIDNFLGCACRVSKKANNQGDFWSPNFDYILTYAKDRGSCPAFFGGVNYAAYDQVDSEGPREGERYQLIRLYMTSLDPMRGCTNQRYYIQAPDGTLLIPPGNTFPTIKKDGEMSPPQTADDKVWRWSRDTYRAEKERIVIKQTRSSNLVDSNGNEVKWNVFTKTYLNDVIEKSSAKPNSLIEDHINQNSSHELTRLGVPFAFAKPSSLIRFLCEISKVGHGDVVLDFFGGSGTTAQAVMDLNSTDNLDRKFIIAQIADRLDPENKNHKEAIAFCRKNKISETIAELCKERIRRAGNAAQSNAATTAPNLDTGFRVLKIDTSNMADVYYAPDAVKQTDLVAHTDNIKPDRTPEDLLFQVLVDWGVDLSLPIKKETFSIGKERKDEGGITKNEKKAGGEVAALHPSTFNLHTFEVFFVDGNALAACFDPKVSEDLVKELAKRRPLRAVFRDSSYDSDSVKINVEQIFKLLSPETEVRSL